MKSNFCPRQVPPEVWEATMVDEVDPTVHMPDIGEEAEIADSLFMLGALGVNPVLLSQLDSPRPTL